MRRRVWVSALGFCLLSSFVLAKQGIVRTRDGKTYDGDVIEAVDHVVIKKGIIEVTVPQNQVLSVQYAGPEDAITQRLNQLKPDDLAGRISIAREAFRAGRYDLARKLATEVLDKDPNNKQAVELQDMIRRQILLEARQKGATQAAQETSSIGTPLPPGELPHEYLTDAEINTIRQVELRDADGARVRVRLDNNVISRYMETPQARNEDFAQLSVYEQAMSIIRNGDADMRKDVVVLSDPGAVRDFRQGGVQKIILTGCGANGCHGSQAGGSFVLFPSADSDAAAYTNFYILSTYQMRPSAPATGVFGGGTSGAKMIDRQSPDRSLLLTYGLPQRFAGSHPHPDVPLFKPAFASANDPQYRRVRTWIAESLAPQEPVYGINYKAPTAAKPTPATVPTTAPAKSVQAPAVPGRLPAPAGKTSPAPAPEAR